MNVAECNLVKLEPMLSAEVRDGHARGGSQLGAFLQGPLYCVAATIFRPSFLLCLL